MKLAAYLRVSTDAQAERGLGLEVQASAIRKWCKTNEHRLTEVFCDEGISGSKDVDVRTGLHSALRAVQEGTVQGIVVYKLDRLARQLTIQEATLAQVWKHGGFVFTCDLGQVHPDDPEDPMRTAMRQMVGVFAQLERGMINSRMRAGRVAKASAGGFAYGSPAFGLAAKNRQLVSEPTESATLKRILELHSQQLSTRQIAALLHQEGRKPKRGDVWHSATVARIIQRSNLQTTSN